MKRLLQESKKNKDDLRPTDDLYHWQAWIKGEGYYNNQAYELDIRVPNEYPMQPPKVRFKTRIVHPNVDYDTGEICLDLLKDRWAPVYTLEQTVEAIRDLMRHPATDSPLNVDAAILLRVGDEIGFKSLVDYLYHEVSP